MKVDNAWKKHSIRACSLGGLHEVYKRGRRGFTWVTKYFKPILMVPKIFLKTFWWFAKSFFHVHLSNFYYVVVSLENWELTVYWKISNWSTGKIKIYNWIVSTLFSSEGTYVKLLLEREGLVLRVSVQMLAVTEKLKLMGGVMKSFSKKVAGAWKS